MDQKMYCEDPPKKIVMWLRGITLLTIARKLFAGYCWLKKEIDLKLRKNQAAFRIGRSCREQIFTLRNITEQSLEHQLPKRLTAFIDHPYGTYCPYMKFHRSTQIYSKHWIQARAAVPKLKLEWQIFSPLCWVCNKVVFYHNSFFESILTLWCEKQ